MTPFSLIRFAFKHLPKIQAMYIVILMQFSYIFVDHYVYDLTPNIHIKQYNKIIKIESGINQLLLTCKKGVN